MKTVYKYSFPWGGEIEIELPKGAEILDIASQTGVADQLVMWCLVDTEAPLETKKFYLFGTGHPIPEYLTWYEHIATVQVEQFVWHIFEQASSNDGIHQMCQESAAYLRSQIQTANMVIEELQQKNE